MEKDKHSMTRMNPATTVNGMHMLRRTWRAGALAAALLLSACGAPTAATQASPTAVASSTPTTPATPPTPESAPATPTILPTPTPLLVSPIPTPAPVDSPLGASVPVYSYQVVNSYPHDPDAFTQGLVFTDGVLYESTGLRGRSSLRRVALDSGEVLQRKDVAAPYFAEGLALFGDRLIQLTWQENTAFVYDKDSFEQVGTFSYPTEGWGLTHDGTNLIMSDGSPTLRFFDPATFAPVREVAVTYNGQPVEELNELEYVNGEVWANI
jgi:glutamine cyclotransferase